MGISNNWKQWRYSLLAQTKQDVDNGIELSDLPAPLHRQSTRLQILLLIGNMVMFVLTCIMFFDMACHKMSMPKAKELNAALRAASSYSPIFDMIDLEPSVKKINGSLKAPENPSIARQFPNPVADAIWGEDIELIRPIPITREQILKMGKNPDTVAKLENTVWGLGDDAYVAALDIFHNLHCLNTLRRAIYHPYYNLTTASTHNHTSSYEVHINHCMDILYQHISCSNNLNLVTRHWKEGYDYPFPDFSISAQCINFDKLTAWHKEASVDMEKYAKVMRKPHGVKEEPAEM